MELNRRISIIPTTKCNQRCDFCFEKDSLNNADIPLEEAKRMLQRAMKLTAYSVDFMGGEVNLYPNIMELIKYANNIGYKDIGIITNGYGFENFEKVKEMVSEGLSTIVFTVLGGDEKLHDSITKVPGSFENLQKAIQNVKQTNLTLRVNIVITKSNYIHLEKIAKLVKTKFGPKITNFLFYMYCDDNHTNSSNELRYSEVIPYLKNSLKILPSKSTNVRHLPYCMLKKEKKRICNMYDIHYDKYEWDYYLKDKLKNGKIVNFYHVVKGLFLENNKSTIIKDGMAKASRRAIINIIKPQNYIKSKSCSKCKFDKDCEGIWKGYAKRFGLEEFEPIKND